MGKTRMALPLSPAIGRLAVSLLFRVVQDRETRTTRWGRVALPGGLWAGIQAAQVSPRTEMACANISQPAAHGPAWSLAERLRDRLQPDRGRRPSRNRAEDLRRRHSRRGGLRILGKQAFLGTPLCRGQQGSGGLGVYDSLPGLRGPGGELRGRHPDAADYHSFAEPEDSPRAGKQHAPFRDSACEPAIPMPGPSSGPALPHRRTQSPGSAEVFLVLEVRRCGPTTPGPAAHCQGSKPPPIPSQNTGQKPSKPRTPGYVKASNPVVTRPR
jgi:hypothetical protein